MTPLAHLAQRPGCYTGVSYARHSPPRAGACQAHRQARLAVTLRAASVLEGPQQLHRHLKQHRPPRHTPQRVKVLQLRSKVVVALSPR